MTDSAMKGKAATRTKAANERSEDGLILHHVQTQTIATTMRPGLCPEITTPSMLVSFRAISASNPRTKHNDCRINYLPNEKQTNCVGTTPYTR